MGLSVTVHAPYTRMTTLGRVKYDLGITDDVQDPWLLDKIDEATQAIEDACRRTFARENVTEFLPGDGGTILQLERTPVVAVGSVSKDGQIITDWSIADADAGHLYRDAGWDWTVQPRTFIEPYYGPLTERPAFSVSYTGGYLMPEDDLTWPMQALASDKSFNVDGAMFPMLVPGDRISMEGWEHDVNKGTWTVASRTATKVTAVETGIVDAPAAEDRQVTMKCQTLPSSLRSACASTAKTFHQQRGVNPLVSSRSVGGLSISYRTGVSGGGGGGYGACLPSDVIISIKRWIRRT